MNWADIIVLVLAVILILSVAVQQSQDSVQDAFSGEKSELFKNQKARGLDLLLMRVTMATSLLFVGMVFVSLLLHKNA
ncbi:MAG: preprotein translocase subunit SecG [Paracholeplasma sp.]|uniref:Protein-export membrane protein SecG n=1 Tax=Acholeplasma brassicae TaxID=61635 RepID=U4KPI0_9MOLU|nr:MULTISPECIES: preprotein translocase subunit SecG [Paracholeplasma]MDY3195233.1 preprotein translocase subunit SecG [Paracholeplasma sp.]CCV66251.1 protein-export translocase membrane protein, similar to preprotein translocase SecG subunit [Paracholeplasma brassicae]